MSSEARPMTDTADLLVELGTEELPPKALRRLEGAFADSVRARIDDAGLAMGELHSFATPRRLAILITDLQKHQAPQNIEKRGPPTRIAFDGDCGENISVLFRCFCCADVCRVGTP